MQSLIEKGSRVQVRNRYGIWVLAGTRRDVFADEIGGKRRRALGALYLFKEDHPNGGRFEWKKPAGEEFIFESGPSKKET